MIGIATSPTSLAAITPGPKSGSPSGEQKLAQAANKCARRALLGFAVFHSKRTAK